MNNNGIDIAVNNSKQTIGTSSVRVLSASPRQVLVLRNASVGAQVITIAQGNTKAVLNEGIILSPGQSWLDSDNSAFYQCWEGEVQAISDDVGAVLTIHERARK